LNSELLKLVMDLKSKHPYWGYLRIWACIRRIRHNYQINLKRIYRLLKENGLLNDKEKKLKTSREPRSKPRATRLREYLGIDAIKFWINGFGWANLIVLIDWYTKELINYRILLRNDSIAWRKTLEGGLIRCNRKFTLVSDHGSQPTSRSFMNFCKENGVNQIFATFNNPKGNADTERVIRTIKEEVFWINEFETIEEVNIAMKEFVKFYNNEYCHSSLGYMSPVEYYEKWKKENENVAA